MRLQDGEFQPLRRSVREAGYPLVLQPSRSIILVRPDQYLQTLNSEALPSRILKRYNVIITESEEYPNTRGFLAYVIRKLLQAQLKLLRS